MLVCKSVYVWAHDLSINAGEDRTNIPVEFEFSLMNSYHCTRNVLWVFISLLLTLVPFGQ